MNTATKPVASGAGPEQRGGIPMCGFALISSTLILQRFKVSDDFLSPGAQLRWDLNGLAE